MTAPYLTVERLGIAGKKATLEMHDKGISIKETGELTYREVVALACALLRHALPWI